MSKKRINVVVLGESRSGKSTATLLFRKIGGDINSENERQHSLDYLGPFRRTVNLHSYSFSTKSNFFTITDTPGDSKYFINMIFATSFADVAILIVPPFDDNSNLKERILIAYAFGVKNLIVCVNKMDHVDINYSKEIFEITINNVSKLIDQTGYNNDQVTFIPISALSGENITTESKNIHWWNGRILLEILDSVEAPERALIKKPLRIPILTSFKLERVGNVLVGVIASGEVKNGQKFSIVPSQCKENKEKDFLVNGNVKSIEIFGIMRGRAKEGDYVSIAVGNKIKLDEMRRGMVLGDINYPPKVTKSFTALILFMNHNPVNVGYSPTFYCHTINGACKFEKFIEKYDKKTMKVVEYEPPQIMNGDCALVELSLTKNICLEEYWNVPKLGRIVMIDQNRVVAVGVIKSISVSGDFTKSAIK